MPNKTKREVMDPNRRVTRSTSNARRNPEETEGTYWRGVIDPTDIERGQVEAIRAVRRATSDDPTALLNTTQDAPPANAQGGASIMDDEVPNNLLEEEIPFTSNLTNYTEQSLQLVNAMRTAFVNSSPSTESVERVTTPVEMNIMEMDGPLDPAFTRPSLQRIRGSGSGYPTYERPERNWKRYNGSAGSIHGRKLR